MLIVKIWFFLPLLLLFNLHLRSFTDFTELCYSRLTWQPQQTLLKLIKVTNRCLSSNLQPIFVRSLLHFQVVILVSLILSSSVLFGTCSCGRNRPPCTTSWGDWGWRYLLVCILHFGHFLDFSSSVALRPKCQPCIRHISHSLTGWLKDIHPAHLCSSGAEPVWF